MVESMGMLEEGESSNSERERESTWVWSIRNEPEVGEETFGGVV